MTIKIHLPESIDEFLTELIEKKMENWLQPFFSLMLVEINFRGNITTSGLPFTGAL